jgi:hypothetical protein
MFIPQNLSGLYLDPTLSPWLHPSIGLLYKVAVGAVPTATQNDPFVLFHIKIWLVIASRPLLLFLDAWCSSQAFPKISDKGRNAILVVQLHLASDSSWEFVSSSNMVSVQARMLDCTSYQPLVSHVHTRAPVCAHFMHLEIWLLIVGASHHLQ